jgi:hypothetical protein
MRGALMAASSAGILFSRQRETRILDEFDIPDNMGATV